MRTDRFLSIVSLIAKRILFLFLVSLTLVASFAKAGSLFDLAVTPAPEPIVTPASAPTPTPAPEITPEPTAAPGEETSGPAERGDDSDLTQGLAYTDLTGKEPDRIHENTEDNTREYLYEQVTGDDFSWYADRLASKGCQMEKLNADPATAIAWGVVKDEGAFGFMLVYEQDKQLLTLVFSHALAGGGKTEGRVCPDCDHGKCTECKGKGSFKCELCGGSGICGVCCGDPYDYITDYGSGIGGTYVTCAGCHGTMECEYCGGTGRQDCMFCEGGVCETCHGHYRPET